MTTPQPLPQRPDRAAEQLAALVDEHLEVDRDVIPLTAETWAIHGYLAYEGEVIVATFASEREAWAGILRIDEIRRGRSPGAHR